jgi:hypothetical protein
MNLRTLKRAGINEPPDGFTELEKEIAKVLVSNTVSSIYNRLPTDRMKFIVASHFELGYTQDTVAEILGVTQPTLVDEINLIRRVILGRPHRPKRRKYKVTKEDVIKLLHYMNES